MTNSQINLFEPLATMDDKILYKYRSLQNWKFLLDIFLNKRLYAAMYKDLNDPMEGYYNYQGDLAREFRKTLRNEKASWKICSLTRNYLNTLMWSYYADGHHGVAMGVKVVDTTAYSIRNVDYPMEVHLDPKKAHEGPDQIAMHILSQKSSAWQHEDEVRVFTHAQYVDIDIQKVYLGCYTNEFDCDLITKLVKITAPNAEIVKLDRKQLDQPIHWFQKIRNHGNLRP